MSSNPAGARSGATRAARIAVMLLAAELVLLAATGVVLFFNYGPSAVQAWDDISLLGGPPTFSSVVRDTHRIVSHFAIWTALVAGVLLVIEPSRRSGWARSVLLGAGVFVLVLAGSFSGYLLPFDQLAMWSVTVGSDQRGYTPLMGDQVRFVLLGGREIGTTTLLRWMFIHMVVMGPGALVLAGLAWWRLRAAPIAQPGSS